MSHHVHALGKGWRWFSESQNQFKFKARRKTNLCLSALNEEHYWQMLRNIFSTENWILCIKLVNVNKYRSLLVSSHVYKLQEMYCANGASTGDSFVLLKKLKCWGVNQLQFSISAVDLLSSFMPLLMADAVACVLGVVIYSLAERYV